MKKKSVWLRIVCLCLAASAVLAGCGNNVTSSGDNTSKSGNTTSDTTDASGTDQTPGTTSEDAEVSGDNTTPDDPSGTNSSGNVGSNTSQANNNTSKDSGNSGNPGDPGTTNDPVTLTVWGSQSNESLMLAAVEYEAKNKNVSVKITNKDKVSLNDLKIAIASKTAPDIVNMDAVYVGSSGTQGLLEDLNLLGFNNIKSKFVKAAVDSVTYQNKTYAVPFDTNTLALAYNKDVFDAAGAKVPTNQKELVEAATKIKTKYGTSLYAMSVPFDDPSSKSWNSFIFFFYLWRMGGDILSADLKTATFNSAAGVEALQMIIDMKKNGFFAPKNMSDEFYNGQVGMIETGCFVYDNIFGPNKKANFGITTLPVLKEGVPAYSGIGVYSYGVTTGSKNKAAAYKFAEYYCSNSNYQLQYCKKNNFVPSLLDAQKDSFYSKPEWKVMLEQLKYCKSRPSVAGWESIEKVIADALITALQGKTSPKDALDAAARNVNRILAK